MARLIDAYRPRTIADVVGQPNVVRVLRGFLDSPYSAAFLFEGPTGVGKTSAALALAAELGIKTDDPCGGLVRIPAGEMTADAVRELARELRFMPLSGSTWKVAVIDEVDAAHPKALTVWLDVLERLPEERLVVFTTNNADGLPDRFKDRCERFTFEGSPLIIGPAVDGLLADAWGQLEAEGAAPTWRDIPGAGPGPDGNLSIRRVIMAFEHWIGEMDG